MNTINLRALYEKYSNVDYPIWHPFSAVGRNYYIMPNMYKGDRIYLYDINEKEYIDASSGLWNVSLGYNNQRIMEYITSQLERLPYCSLFENTNPTVIKTATMLLDLLPKNMKKIFFTCSGSESVEIALKAMRQYWHIQGHAEKNTIISFQDSYHGTYYGSMGVSGLEQEQIKEFGVFLGDIKFVNAGECGKCKQGLASCDESCLTELEEYIKMNRERIAGLIIEPIFASKGVGILGDRYINGIARICKQYDILLTVDEVALGFFRTGDAFYIQRYQLEPDIICMAKGINSGYLPMGAVAFSKIICDGFSNLDLVMNHGSTQAGNLLACAAAIASMEEYNELNIAQNVKTMGEQLKALVSESLLSHRNIGEMRGEGLLLGIDLVKNKKNSEPLDLKDISAIQEELRKNGLIVYRSDKGLILLPMLIVNKNQIGNIVDIMVEVFKKILYK